jgi:hypothetical protein
MSNHFNESTHYFSKMISMKKILINPTLFLLTGLYTLKAQNPIPSYNVPVNCRANFQEQRPGSVQLDNSRQPRKIIVRTTGSSSGPLACTATMWIYSLDGLNVLGRYTMYGGETITVEIDERL